MEWSDKIRQRRDQDAIALRRATVACLKEVFTDDAQGFDELCALWDKMLEEAASI